MCRSSRPKVFLYKAFLYKGFLPKVFSNDDIEDVSFKNVKEIRAKNLKRQKQLSRGVLGKRCFENMQQIYRRTPMLKCDFNKVANQLY